MEQQVERHHPPAYTTHDPDTLRLPSVPQHDPYASIQLPDIRSLGLPSSTEFLANGARHTSQWQSPPAQHVFHTPAGVIRGTAADFPRPSTEVGSPEIGVGVKAQGAMVVDDPETRMAAEALSALGKLGTCNNLLHTSGIARDVISPCALAFAAAYTFYRRNLPTVALTR
jgi:hypothetical protein